LGLFGNYWFWFYWFFLGNTVGTLVVEMLIENGIEMGAFLGANFWEKAQRFETYCSLFRTKFKRLLYKNLKHNTYFSY
jgi:hypothetical protein